MDFLAETPLILAFLGILLFVLLSSSVRVLQEYERGVVFRLGRLVGAKGPGLVFLIPGIDKMLKMDLRTITMDVPSQDAITRDNVPIQVNAVVYFRVLDAALTAVRVMDHIRATSQISQTTLRAVLGQSELDELLAQRERINQTLQQIIDEQTDPWGVKVSHVEVKDVELPQAMQRAMARQAEAERERRAKVIHAQGEYEASARLADAADELNRSPAAIQLRYMQTLAGIAGQKNQTIVVPLPTDLLNAIIGRIGGGDGAK
jgi:regulator of protease activity HflC (stomatin/prohibitin superfamily)